MALPGVLEIEMAGLKAWPGIEEEFDRGWVRRAANGYTKRANSVQSLDPTDDAELAARILAASAWFNARGLRPVFRVTPLAAPGVTGVLDELGWAHLEPSRVLAMELTPQQADPRCAVVPLDEPSFVTAQQRLQGYDAGTVSKLRALLGSMTVPATGIVMSDGDGEVVSSALMAVADGIVFTGNVITAPAARRQGHAAAMMRSGLAWAHRQGATVAALNVVATNAAALALYGSLGFRHQYDYVYRLPAPG